MAQIFSKDAQFNAAAPALVANAATALLSTNSQTPPHGNCKAVVGAFVVVTPQAAATAITLTLRRNPAGENVLLATAAIACAVVPAGATGFSISATDAIPDGRDVVYEVVGQQTGAGGNSGATEAFIEAELISG